MIYIRGCAYTGTPYPDGKNRKNNNDKKDTIMTAAELIAVLQGVQPKSEVYFCPSNSNYVEEFSERVESDVEIRTFFGKDTEGVILFSNGQVGAI